MLKQLTDGCRLQAGRELHVILEDEQGDPLLRVPPVVLKQNPLGRGTERNCARREFATHHPATLQRW
jgi:hypothetical protein